MQACSLAGFLDARRFHQHLSVLAFPDSLFQDAPFQLAGQNDQSDISWQFLPNSVKGGILGTGQEDAKGQVCTLIESSECLETGVWIRQALKVKDPEGSCPRGFNGQGWVRQPARCQYQDALIHHMGHPCRFHAYDWKISGKPLHRLALVCKQNRFFVFILLGAPQKPSRLNQIGPGPGAKTVITTSNTVSLFAASERTNKNPQWLKKQ
jgi:hypothetical protein